MRGDLTPAQFKKVKPNGNYGAYQRWLARHRTGKSVVGPLSIADIQKRIYGMIPTQAEQNKQAAWMVNRAIGDQTSALRTASREEQATAERQAKGAEAFGRAFAPLQASFDASVRDAYSQGAGGIRSDASSIAAAVRAAQQGAQSSQAAGARAATGMEMGGDIDAGAAQLQQSGEFAAGPSQTMVGAYHSGAAPIDPFSPGGLYTNPTSARLLDIGSQYRHKSMQSAGDLRKAVAAVQAKRPDLLREAVKGLSDQNLQTLAALTNVLTLQNTMSGTQQDIVESNADIAATKAAGKLATTKAQRDYMASRGLDMQGRPLPGYYRAPNGQVQKVPQFYVVGKNGNLVRKNPYGTTGGGTKTEGTATKPATIDQVSDFRESLMDQGRSMLGIGKMLSAPRKMTVAQIANQLMRLAGQSWIDIYGTNAEPRVRQWVQTAAQQLFTENQAKIKVWAGK